MKIYRESVDITLKSCFCISEVTFGENALAMTSTICRHAADGRAWKGTAIMEARIESVSRHERRISAVLVVHRRQIQCGHPELADPWLLAARRNSTEIAGIRSKQTAGGSMRWHRRWPSPPMTATFTPYPGLTVLQPISCCRSTVSSRLHPWMVTH